MSKKLWCLVLSADHQPLGKEDVKYSLLRVLKGKADIIEVHEGEFLRSPSTSFPAPSVVAVKRYVPLPDHYYGNALLTQSNLKKRDDFTCQYCNRTGGELDPEEFLTRDHVFPKSRGGEDMWENVVLACSTCNNLKADRTPEEADMRLIRTPRAPTRWQLNNLTHLRHQLHEN